jgi:hypothetical protein
MRRKLHPMFLVLLGLIGIGIVYQLMASPSQLIIPLAVFAVVFLLYKFPPGGIRGSRAYKTGTSADRAKPKSKSSQRKTVPFRVIEGGKDDDNLPKYH